MSKAKIRLEEREREVIASSYMNPNKMKRLAFCLKALSEKEKFENIIFADETSMQDEQHARICFRKDGSQPKPKNRSKHPLKVCISLNVMLGSLSFSVNYV